MAKKFIIAFVSTSMALFLFLFGQTYARTVTLDEIGEVIDNSVTTDPDYVYVIGNYIFTQNKELSTSDVMLAARKIDVSSNAGGTNTDKIYGEMTIHRLDRAFDESYAPTGKWEISNNLVGTTVIDENHKFNIRYVDYNYVKDIFKVTFDTNGGNTIDPIMVEEGNKLSLSQITEPTRDKKHFKGWYTYNESGDEIPYNFNNEVTSDLTLKAEWYDEVNTDELLETAEQNIQKNPYYGVKFDKEKRTFTFKIYDLNKKNSELSDIGSIENIVNILRQDNVVFLTIGNVLFRKEDIPTGDIQPDSPITKKFQELLKYIVGDERELSEILLGDFVISQKDIKLFINLDESKVRSQNNNVVEEYSIKFEYDSQATVSTQIPESEKQVLEGGTWNYDLTDSYTMKYDNGNYKMEGYLMEQKDVKGFSGNAKTGFYFAVSIIPTEVNDNIRIYIPDANGGHNVYKKNDLVDGQLVLLFSGRMDKDRYIDISVDLDGPDEDNYQPTTIRIDYSEVNFYKLFDVKFEFPDGQESKMLQVVDGETVTPPENNPQKDFHGFMYWSKGNKQYDFNLPVEEDMTLIPHWNLKAEEFITTVAHNFNSREEFNDKFNLESDDSNIKIDVMEEGLPLKDLSETTLPGTIMYVLNKQEVTELNLKYDDSHSVEEFTTEDSKETIIAKTKQLLTEIMEDEESSTFDDFLNLEDVDFELEIAGLDDTVELTDEPSTYNIIVSSEFRVVANEDELKRAVQNPEVKRVIIDEDITVKEPISITNNASIIGGGHTIKMEDNANRDYIFIVNSKGKISIDNLKLPGSSKSAIMVENGAEVTCSNLDVSGSGEAGIEVRGIFSYNQSGGGKALIYNEEDYDHPAIKIPSEYKDGAKVNISGVTRIDDYKKVTKQDSEESDEIESTGNINYYLNETHSRLYYVGFMNDFRAKTSLRYCKYGEIPIMPCGSVEAYIQWLGAYYNTGGKRYKFSGWGTVRNDIDYRINYKTDDFSSATKGERSSAWYFAVYTQDSMP